MTDMHMHKSYWRVRYIYDKYIGVLNKFDVIDDDCHFAMVWRIL